MRACLVLGFLSPLFIVALALRFASLRTALFLPLARVILSFLLVSVSTGISGWSFFGKARKPLFVSLRLRLIDSESFSISRSALNLPLNGLMRVVSLCDSLTEFLADTDSFLPCTLRASPYVRYMFCTLAVTPISLLVRVESLRETISSGARVTSKPLILRSIVSEGIWNVIFSLAIFPLISDLEKLYRLIWDNDALPFISALMAPSALMPKVSGRTLTRVSRIIFILPSMLNDGSYPSRSFALPFKPKSIPSVTKLILSMEALILPRLSVLPLALKPIFISIFSRSEYFKSASGKLIDAEIFGNFPVS